MKTIVSLRALPVVFTFACWGIAVAAASSAAQASGAEHVIHVSVDGLNAQLLADMIEAGQTPTFKRLRDEGASTFNARTDYSHTNTLPNHTCMFTGRPTLVPEGMPDAPCHGWKTNRVPKVGGVIHDPKNPNVGYVASVFDVVHDAGLSTALYASKDKFCLYDQSYDESNGAMPKADEKPGTASGPTAAKRGRDKIDSYFYAGDMPPRFSESMHQKFLADLREKNFNYAFVHYRDADSAGHALGWGGSSWKYMLRNMDECLGELVQLIESDPELAGKTTLIVATDHGGQGFEHDTPTIRENYTIPILVWGAGVGQGDLYEMNRATRTEPGESRPEYTAPSQPIRNDELGNLALTLLGLEPIPGSMINVKQDLRVTHPTDAAAAQ